MFVAVESDAIVSVSKRSATLFQLSLDFIFLLKQFIFILRNLTSYK